mgnify:CR=1 FL=1
MGGDVTAGRVVIAGATSGVGKTTIATALMGALRRRGLQVRPFKAGPDYIDPSYHVRACGAPSRNLDSWMLSADAIRELFGRAVRGADVAVIEGVMGLFDGRDEPAMGSPTGSTAELAKLLDAPVLVVLDVGATAQSAGAMALGYQRLDPSVRVAGYILNQVASEGHYRMAADAVRRATGLPVVGSFPKRQALAVPERHLGLIPTTESRIKDGFFDRLAAQGAASLDLDAILALARLAGPLSSGPPRLFPAVDAPVQARLAVAQDEAFGFYYQDGLDLLAAWGAELVPFSPLRESSLPPETDGVYLGGGFPELFATELSANRAMLAAIRRAAEEDVPVYAECGGLMYLCEGIVDFEGRRHPMAGLVPGWSAMQRERLSLGYATVTARGDGPLLRRGQSARGHEFHWSTLDRVDPEAAAYEVAETPGRTEGYQRGSVLASYVHLHFGADPRLAPSFVAACAARRRRRSAQG